MRGTGSEKAVIDIATTCRQGNNSDTGVEGNTLDELGDKGANTDGVFAEAGKFIGTCYGEHLYKTRSLDVHVYPILNRI